MFCIKIAGVVIGIEHRYGYIKRLCKDYIVEHEEPAFTVSVSRREIRKEAKSFWFIGGYSESLCLYRHIAMELIRYDAFLMHSAVVAVDSEAYAFAAKSGTGKSTHLQLWLKEFGERATVVNGDKPIYRFIDGTLYACGTPWMGKESLGTNTMVPLKALYFLERSPENRVTPIGMREAMGKVFHQLLLPKDEEGIDAFFPLVEKMLTTCECWRLQCNMKPEAARVAYARGKIGAETVC